MDVLSNRYKIICTLTELSSDKSIGPGVPDRDRFVILITMLWEINPGLSTCVVLSLINTGQHMRGTILCAFVAVVTLKMKDHQG